jgi:hypothetical protein
MNFVRHCVTGGNTSDPACQASTYGERGETYAPALET